MQIAGANRSNMVNTAINIAKNEGLPTFYKGALSPLLGASFSSACSFSALRLSREGMKWVTNRKQLTDAQLVLTGGMTGAAVSFISNPVELVRIKI